MAVLIRAPYFHVPRHGVQLVLLCPASRMKLPKLQLVLFLPVLAFLSGCGSPGVPLPPSLELARPVSDLHAVRKGSNVVLSWTPPSRTTDGHNITHPGETAICEQAGAPVKDCKTPVARIKTGRQETTQQQQISYTARLEASLQLQNPAADVFYAVNVLNAYGRSAGLSNQVSVPAAPTLPAPADFSAKLTAEGVRLSWRPITPPALVERLRYAVRIYRHEQGQAGDAVAGEAPLASSSASEFSDQTFEWEKTYVYRACVVTYVSQADGSERQVEGDNTPSVSILAHDVFPPATPTGLQAVFSGPGQKPFIDLIWTPNTEVDLAGYNVYRREGGGQPAKVNSELVKSPAWRDSDITPGQEYWYSVTAVDARGNESQRSEEASETFPAQ